MGLTIRRLRSGATVAVVAAGLSVLVAGCGLHTGSPVSAGAQQQFLTDVHAQAADIATYRSDVQLVRLGQTVCTDLDAHASVQEVADRIPLVEGSNPLPPPELGAVIAAAVGTLCPQYHDKLSGGGLSVP